MKATMDSMNALTIVVSASYTVSDHTACVHFALRECDCRSTFALPLRYFEEACRSGDEANATAMVVTFSIMLSKALSVLVTGHAGSEQHAALFAEANTKPLRRARRDARIVLAPIIERHAAADVRNAHLFAWLTRQLPFDADVDP